MPKKGEKANPAQLEALAVQRNKLRPDTPAKMVAILAKMRDGVPFISLCSEACGVSRDTVFHWIHQGENNPKARAEFVDFAQQVRQIRSEWMLKTAKELCETPPAKTQTEHYRRKTWLLERMDRDLFDPPRFPHEKRDDKSEAQKLKSTPEQVAQATQALSEPEPEPGPTLQ